jgi:hypothetical protein
MVDRLHSALPPVSNRGDDRREVGPIRASAQQITGENIDWRFFNDLKR